jgi:hypothetical protein
VGNLSVTSTELGANQLEPLGYAVISSSVLYPETLSLPDHARMQSLLEGKCQKTLSACGTSWAQMGLRLLRFRRADGDFAFTVEHEADHRKESPGLDLRFSLSW